MEILRRPINASYRIPDRFCVISMEFLSLSLRRSFFRHETIPYTHKNGVFGENSVTGQSWASPISKVDRESHIGQVVLRCKNGVQCVGVLSVNFKMFYLMWFVTHFTIGVTLLLLPSRVSLLVICIAQIMFEFINNILLVH